MIKVSAIVSVYKAEKFIRGCLEDLTSQTLYEKNQLEIVIVNSGSPENEDAIIKEFANKYKNISYIKTEQREGIYTAWNRGIKAARGKYVTNANTDDRHRKDALEIMAKYLDEMPEVDLVYGDLYVTKTPNLTFEQADKQHVIIREDFSVNIMLEGCQMGPQPMWRKSVHEKIGYFNDAYKSAGDYEFWLRMVFLNNSKMYHIKDFLGLYLFNEQGIELGNQKLSIYETGVIIDTYKKFIVKNSLPKKGEPIDIVFLTHNRLNYFFGTIDALIKNTRYPYRIIVVDNASNEKFGTYLKQAEILFDKIIFNDKNEWTKAFQKGIDYSESDPFIVSDPDILVPNLEGKCWLERIVNLHEKYPEIGLLALNLDASNKPVKMPDVYIGEKQPYNDEIVLANVGTVMQSIKRKYFDFPYETDWETCERIRQNGGKVGFAKNIVAYHLGWNEEKDYPDYMVEKYKYFKEKYKVDTYKLYTENKSILEKMDEIDENSEYYSYDRPEIRKLVGKSAKKILDVGCAAGALGAKLKEELGAEVWGIEIFEKAAKVAAKKLDKVLIGDIVEKSEELPESYFDTVIFADVLEHLAEPEKALRKIAKALKSDGEIIVSVPNVRHWTVIKALLEGTWRYENAGILDRTHLRFFTFETAAEMLSECGFETVKAEATALNDYKFPESLIEKLSGEGFAVNDLREKSFHYQYIFVAKKKKSEKKVSVIIPVYNQAEYTKRMLASLNPNGKFNLEIIIVDNDSDAEAKTVIKDYADKNKNVKVITNEKNLGFPKAVNQGLRIAEGDYAVIANNDIILPENWYERMLDLAESKKNIGLVGPVSNKVSGVQHLKDFDNLKEKDAPRKMKEIAEKQKGKSFAFPRIAFLFVLIKKEVIEKLGGLDERFSPGNYEDDDYCLRAQLAGFETAIALDVFVFHHGSASFKKDGEEKYNSLLETNRRKFIEKWGVSPDEIWLEKKIPKKNEIYIPLNGNNFAELIRKANVFIERGDFSAAKSHLEKAIENYDENYGIPLAKLEDLLGKINSALSK